MLKLRNGLLLPTQVPKCLCVCQHLQPNRDQQKAYAHQLRPYLHNYHGSGMSHLQSDNSKQSMTVGL